MAPKSRPSTVDAKEVQEQKQCQFNTDSGKRCSRSATRVLQESDGKKLAACPSNHTHQGKKIKQLKNVTRENERLLYVGGIEEVQDPIPAPGPEVEEHPASPVKSVTEDNKNGSGSDYDDDWGADCDKFDEKCVPGDVTSSLTEAVKTPLPDNGSDAEQPVPEVHSPPVQSQDGKNPAGKRPLDHSDEESPERKHSRNGEAEPMEEEMGETIEAVSTGIVNIGTGFNHGVHQDSVHPAGRGEKRPLQSPRARTPKPRQDGAKDKGKRALDPVHDVNVPAPVPVTNFPTPVAPEKSEVSDAVSADPLGPLAEIYTREKYLESLRNSDVSGTKAYFAIQKVKSGTLDLKDLRQYLPEKHMRLLCLE